MEEEVGGLSGLQREVVRQKMDVREREVEEEGEENQSYVEAKEIGFWNHNGAVWTLKECLDVLLRINSFTVQQWEDLHSPL